MISTDEAQTDPHTGRDDLDLRALWAAIRRKRAWILGPTIAAVLVAGLFILVVKPRYTAESEILLENQESFLTRPERTETPREATSGLDAEYVASQIQLVTSRDLARRAITELGLVGNPEFDPLAHGVGPISRVLVLFGLMRDPTRIPPEDRVLQAYLDRLTVYSPTKTRVLTIEFRSTDPDLAARAANEIARLYLETQSEAKRNAARAAATSLAAEIADLRAKVQHAAAAVEQFRSSTGLLAGTNNMTISGQQLAELNSELSRARNTQAGAQAKAGLIRDMLKQGRISEVADVANNDLVRRIAEQRVTVKAQLALESRTLLPGHPRIKELKAEIADLEGELRSAADKTARGLENDARIAAARVANLETAIDQQKKSVTAANVDDVHLRELERVAQAYRDQLQSSTTKYQEAVGRENSPAPPADARIIARASVPQEPSYPKKLPTLVFAAVAGFVLSLGAVVSGELLGAGEGGGDPDSVTSPTTRQRPYLTRQILAPLKALRRPRAQPPVAEEPIMPPLPIKPEDTGDLPARPFGRRSRTARPRDEGKGLRIVATSLEDDPVATARLIDFARELTHDGRPIIVDLDARSTRLAALVAERSFSGLGLSDLAVGNASFGEVIHRDRASRLHFVSFGMAPGFAPADLDLILDALLQTYDFLVVAAPPLDKSPMATELAAHADMIALAAPARMDEAGLEAASEQFYEAGAAEVVVLDGQAVAERSDVLHVA